MKKYIAFAILFAALLWRTSLTQADENINNYQFCGGGSYKVDDWKDADTEVEITWAQTPGFACNDGIESVTFSIKAGNDFFEPNSCFGASWDQNGWKVWEKWTSEAEKKALGCKDISHVTVSWLCNCPEPTATPTQTPTPTPTPTPTMTPTPTATPTQAPTPTQTPTPTGEVTPTPTQTPTPTTTVAPTATPTQIPTPTPTGSILGGIDEVVATPSGSTLGVTEFGDTGSGASPFSLSFIGYLMVLTGLAALPRKYQR